MRLNLKENERIESKKSGKMYMGQRVTEVRTNRRIVKVVTLYSLYTKKEFLSFVHDKKNIAPKFQHIISSVIHYRGRIWKNLVEVER